MATDKLERLLNLTALLINTSAPLPARRVHELMGESYPPDDDTFRRKFERDKRDLKDMGVPLVVEDVPGTFPVVEGYRIPPDEYFLRDPGLDADERAALALAASLVRLDERAADAGLRKVGGAAGVPTEAADELAQLPGGADLAALFQAVIDERPVRFSYRGEPRTVDPYRLDYQRGRWYLSGYDHARGEERTYRLDRIEGNVVSAEGPRFTRPTTAVPGGPVEPWQLGEGDPYDALVLVDGEHATEVLGYLGESDVVDRRPDGSVVVRLRVSDVAGFRTFVMRLQHHAEVLEPPALRAAIVGWLEDLATEQAST